MTVYKIIRRALAMIGVAADGIAPDSYEAIEGLESLNMLLSAMSGRDMISRYYDYSLTADEDKQYISMGSNGVAITDIAERPSHIDQVSITLSGDGSNTVVWDVPLITYEEYRLISNNQVTTIPRVAAWDFGSPISLLYMFPRLQQGYTVRIIGTKNAGTYLQMNETFIEPPEQWEDIVTNLALRLAVIFGVKVDTELARQAHSANKILKREMVLNKTKRLQNPATTMGSNLTGFNYITGLTSGGYR